MRKMAFLQANWYKAEQYCRFHNMHLASINSEEEQRELEVGLVTEFKNFFNWVGQDPLPFTPLIQIVTHNIYLSQEHITGFGMGNEHFWSSGTDQGEESK